MSWWTIEMNLIPGQGTGAKFTFLFVISAILAAIDVLLLEAAR